MNEIRGETLTLGVESCRRYKVMEMHLFDEELHPEEDLCGAGASAVSLRSVSGYLEDRLHGHRVGTVCEGCKALSIPFALNLAQDLEVEGSDHEGQKYRQLVKTLARETGQNPPDG